MDIEEDLVRIALQEERLRFASFDAAKAWDLGLALKAAANRRNAPVAIDISAHSHQLFYSALPGTTPDNAEWVRRKRNVTLRFFKSSYAIGLALQRGQTTLEAKFGLKPDDYMAHGGSFPLRLQDGVCVGAVTVSGLPQREDHDLVSRVLAEFLHQHPGELALA